jgi:hypothetical protein
VGARAQACVCARLGLLIPYVTRGRSSFCVISGFTIFSTLSHKRYDFRKKVTELKMSLFNFLDKFI